MREFRITEEQIKRLGLASITDLSQIGQITYIQDLLHQWFPVVFEPEWEEVPLSDFIRTGAKPEGLIYGDPEFMGGVYPLVLSIRKGYEDRYKIEDGKIWRRKA